MTQRSNVLVFALVMAMTFVPVVSSAKAKTIINKTHPNIEVYSATDLASGNIPVFTADGATPDDAAPAAPVERSAPKPRIQPKPRQVVQAVPTLTVPFDQVPEGQVEALSTRLKIVDELIRKHGRAYDYRTLTISELKAQLNALEEKPVAQQEAKREVEEVPPSPAQAEEAAQPAERLVAPGAPEPEPYPTTAPEPPAKGSTG